MAAGTRERMVFSAMQLFRERGYSGTGFRDVVAYSATPRGSIYHHFPGGKAELGVDAVALAADFIDAALADALSSAPPADGFLAFLHWWIDFLEVADFQAGCPVLAVAVETHPRAPELVAAADAAFSRWEGTLARALGRAGVSPDQSAELATLVIAAIEGAMVMSRASRDRQPLLRVAAQLTGLLQAAVSSAM